MYGYVYLDSAVRQMITERQEWAARERLVASIRPRRRVDVLKAFARLGHRRQPKQVAVSGLAPGFTPAP